MRHLLLATVLSSFSVGALAAPRHAPPPTPLPPCAAAASAAEHKAAIPVGLLGTISLVEAGRPDPVTGRAVAWPWTINADGVGHFYDSKDEAVAAVSQLRAAGAHSIDVGCMQISLLYHPDAFADLETAFDPASNATFAARFLVSLYHHGGDWLTAAAAYHSQTPEIGAGYEARVVALWTPPPGMQLPVLATRADVAQASRVAAHEAAIYTPEYLAMLHQARADNAKLHAEFGPTENGIGRHGEDVTEVAGRRRGHPPRNSLQARNVTSGGRVWLTAGTRLAAR